MYSPPRTITSPQKASSLMAFLSLLFMALAVYIIFMPFPELRASDEAMYADVAADMLANNHWLNPHFQGAPISCFPLYPWLVAFFLKFNLPAIIAVRLPSVLALFAIALESGLMARKHRDATAGFIAATIVLTNFASFRIGIVAQRETLHALLLTSAWFAWYQFGQQMQKWKLAWGTALALVTLDMTNVGLRAPIIFYLPMLLTTMPPKTRRRLQRPRHLTWLIVFSLLFYLWIQLICNHPVLPWNSAIGGLTETLAPGFFKHILRFPLACALYLMPWGLFIWAPFCLALRPLEPKGSSCGFFRAVVFCPAVFCWLMPGQSPLMLLCALGPLAFLISMNAEILLHRYDRFFSSVIRWLCRIGIVCCVAVSAFWFAVYCGSIVIAPSPDMPPADCHVMALLLGCLAILCLIVLLYEEFFRMPCYRKLAWGTCILRVAYLALFLPIAYFTVSDRSFAARQLTQWQSWNELCNGNPPDFIYSNTDSSLPVQCHYLNIPVRHLTTSLDELPKKEKTAFLISPFHPTDMHRSWEVLSPKASLPPVNMNQLRRYYWTPWQEVLDTRRLMITRVPIVKDLEAHPRYRPSEECRIYRGVLLNEESQNP